MPLAPQDLVNRLRTLYDEKEGRLACFLLAPEDIEVLEKSPIFDWEMMNPKYRVRGHIWEVAVRESNFPPGQISFEAFPRPLEKIVPTPIKPWYADLSIDTALNRIDQLLTWQLYEKCDRELRLIDIDKVDDTAALLIVLTGTRPKGSKLPYWPELVQKIEARLITLKGEEYAADCLKGLREPSDGPTVTEWAASMRGETVVLPSQEQEPSEETSSGESVPGASEKS